MGDVRQVEVIYLVEKEKCPFMGEWMSRATQELACSAKSMEEVRDETVARWGGVGGEVIGKASVQDALQEMRAWRAAQVETEPCLRHRMREVESLWWWDRILCTFRAVK